MSWQNIIQDPEFQQQSYDVKKRVAENYFKRNMIDDEYNNQSPDIQMSVFNNFLSTIGTPQQGGNIFDRIRAERSKYEQMQQTVTQDERLQQFKSQYLLKTYEGV